MNSVESKKSPSATKKLMDSVAHTTDEQIWLRKPPGEILSGRMVPGKALGLSESTGLR